MNVYASSASFLVSLAVQGTNGANVTPSATVSRDLGRYGLDLG